MALNKKFPHGIIFKINYGMGSVDVLSAKLVLRIYVEYLCIRCSYMVHVFGHASYILGMQFIWIGNDIAEDILTWT